MPYSGRPQDSKNSGISGGCLGKSGPAGVGEETASMRDDAAADEPIVASERVSTRGAVRRLARSVGRLGQAREQSREVARLGRLQHVLVESRLEGSAPIA